MPYRIFWFAIAVRKRDLPFDLVFCWELCPVWLRDGRVAPAEVVHLIPFVILWIKLGLPKLDAQTRICPVKIGECHVVRGFQGWSSVTVEIHLAV